KLVGFVMEERGIPREGYGIVDEEGHRLGEVTSGSQSPVLGKGIGLGYVPNDPAYTAPGATLYVDVRGRLMRVTVTKVPFHKVNSGGFFRERRGPGGPTFPRPGRAPLG